jgi:hypothetical protein
MQLALCIEQHKRLASNEFVVGFSKYMFNYRHPVGDGKSLAIVLAVDGNSLQYIEKVLSGGHFEIALLH